MMMMDPATHTVRSKAVKCSDNQCHFVWGASKKISF